MSDSTANIMGIIIEFPIELKGKEKRAIDTIVSVLNEDGINIAFTEMIIGGRYKVYADSLLDFYLIGLAMGACVNEALKEGN